MKSWCVLMQGKRVMYVRGYICELMCHERGMVGVDVVKAYCLVWSLTSRAYVCTHCFFDGALARFGRVSCRADESIPDRQACQPLWWHINEIAKKGHRGEMSALLWSGSITQDTKEEAGIYVSSL